MRKFIAKNNEEFVFREPKKSDAHAYLEYLNDLVDEGAPINLERKQTLGGVETSLKERVDKIKRGQVIGFIAEKNGKIISICEVKRRTGRMSHVADLGVAVSKKYRRIGIGWAISSEVLSRAKEKGVEIVRLEVLEDNIPATTLYRKLGFVKETVLKDEIKEGDKYKNCVLMSLYLGK